MPQVLIHRFHRLSYELRSCEPIILWWSAQQPVADDSAVAQPTMVFFTSRVLAQELTGETPSRDITLHRHTPRKNAACRGALVHALTLSSLSPTPSVSLFVLKTDSNCLLGPSLEKAMTIEEVSVIAALAQRAHTTNIERQLKIQALSNGRQPGGDLLATGRKSDSMGVSARR